jgi:hypothetical protein
MTRYVSQRTDSNNVSRYSWTSPIDSAWLLTSRGAKTSRLDQCKLMMK